MSFLDLVRRRQSVRQYLSRPVERDKVERCLEAARLAPSASNAQPWRFVVADDPVLVGELGKAGYNRFTRSVPAFVAVVCEPGKAVDRLGWLAGRDYRLIGLGMAAEHFCLQAAEEGLGTCMLGSSTAPEEALQVPPNQRIQILVAQAAPPR
jgi:nitroreductase